MAFDVRGVSGAGRSEHGAVPVGAGPTVASQTRAVKARRAPHGGETAVRGDERKSAETTLAVGGVAGSSLTGRASDDPCRGGETMVGEYAAEGLAIAGLVPLSSVDWPGRLAATVFCQGCPLRCPYCQNAAILDPRVPGTVPWSEVEALLARRRGLLDGVVFSGGEALRQEALLDAMARVRAAGFDVGLHTAGVYPRRFTRALPLVDWVGLDVKATASDYARATGAASGDKAWESLNVLLAETARRRGGDRPLEYEIRTTVYPGAPATERFEEVVQELARRGVRRFALQEARTEGTPADFRDRFLGDRAAWQERLAHMAERAGALFDHFELRPA